MQKLYVLFSFLLFAVLPFSLKATHIVGGEMTYKCLGNNQYEIKLTIFRDCFNGVPWFDDPAAIGIFRNSNNTLFTNILVPLDPMLNDTLDPTLASDCLVIPPNVCVNTTTYTTVVTLPFLAGGYHLVYQRCCRNNTIANLINPEAVGATYSIVISEQALQQCNSSPVFNDWPPLFLCVNLPFQIDQSAVDIDGDSLVYKLCNPLDGASQAFPMPQPPNNPPYDTVPWAGGYGVGNMINNPPTMPMTIDPVTGLLTGTPNLIGQFVIGICVEEYRNGVLIGTNRRDYQVNIGDCEVITAAFFAPETICDSYTVSFDNQSQNANDYLWFFNDPANPGASSISANPSYTYSDTGLYEITLVAEPGTLCADTFSAQVHIQPNSLFPDFEVNLIQCAVGATIAVTDLSVDTFSNIVNWNWVMVVNGVSMISDQQNPIFVLTSGGSVLLNLTVTAANGCTASYEESFTVDLMTPILELGPNVQDCQLAQFTLDAGPGFAGYEWSNGASTQTITVTTAGTYWVNVTDACDEMQSDTIQVLIDTTVLDLPDVVEVCEGGSFTFDVPGFVSYEWSPADYLSCTDCPNPTTTPLASIVYTLTVLTADSCTSTDSVLVALLPGIQTSETQAICEGDTILVFGNEVATAGDYSETFSSSAGCDSTHTVTVIVNPVAATSESIEICDGETVEIFGNPVTMAGIYTETFSTVNGCDSTHTVALTVLPVFATSESIAICDGETILVFGNPVSAAGDYSETFTAANGCDSTHTISVEVLPNAFTTEDIAICFGENVDIFGTPTSTSGVFMMTFPSANGCDSTHTITLTVYDEITVQIDKTDASCFGGANGTATATASGGTGGFLYSWSNGNNGPTAAALVAGTYTVSVTDASGCTREASVTIGEPDALVAIIAGQNVTCTALGSASASATGGTGAISFEWNTGSTNADITDLVAGTYTVTATDENSCTSTAMVEITGALGPNVSIQIDQPVTAMNPSSGQLTANITGGAAPIGIEWNNGETTASIDSLGSGEYIVTVTDANGCTATDVAYLFVPGCIGDRIWEDIDRDGCQEGGEFGMANIKLTLTGTDIWGNAVNLTQNTSNVGQYLFEGLAPGTYKVAMTIPQDYTTTPKDACNLDWRDSDFNAGGATDNVILAEGVCLTTVDGGLHDDCPNIVDAGVICCDQFLCGPGDDPDPITPIVPASGGSPIEYMWMYSHVPGPPAQNGTWIVVSGPNGPINTPSYDPGPLSQTTYFVRCARAAGCDWLESNVVTITVGTDAIAAISGPDAVCVGDVVTYSAYLNPTGASYVWDFGYNATPAVSTAPSVGVSYSQAGVYYITLIVINNGCVSTDVLPIAVTNSPNLCNNLQNSNGNTWQVLKPGSGKPSKAGAHVFPNPVSDELNIQWEEAIATDVEIELMGIDGRHLLNFKAREGDASFRTGLSGLQAGMYLLQLRYADGEQEMFRIVKQ
ncbi:MAG: T9SS type A sorting domain-containing protein [Lewinellaceae bacterium]|nr:T9SS type A sorting domain-containing protein [Saprospiraceae bacterium]MCB9338599.1 T9SS type A sorting domain-containing protein [Lewinellaceae bacterium]